MASGAAKKKTAAGNTPAASKKSSSTAKTKQSTAGTRKKPAVKKETVISEQRGETTNPLILKEAALWLILAVCILIFISYIGFGGYVGEVVADVSFGIFGVFAYLFPFLLFMAAAFLISNRGSRIAGIKVGACAGLYLCLCSFAALFTRQYEMASGIVELYEKSAAYKTGGGVIGGEICTLFCKALGALGTGIVLFVFMIICAVLATQKSLFGSVKRQGTKMVQSARESAKRRKAELEEQGEELQLLEEPETVHYANQGLSRSAVKERRQVSQEQQERRSRPERRRRDRSRTMRSRREEREAEVLTSAREPQLDIPVAFPVHERTYRMERRVTGVTMDTRIPANRGENGAEIREIRPERAPQRSKAPRYEEVEQESYYIDLEKLDGSGLDAAKENRYKKKKEQVYSENYCEAEQTSEAAYTEANLNMDLHIEGIEPEKIEKPALEEDAWEQDSMDQEYVGRDQEIMVQEHVGRDQEIMDQEHVGREQDSMNQEHVGRDQDSMNRDQDGRDQDSINRPGCMPEDDLEEYEKQVQDTVSAGRAASEGKGNRIKSLDIFRSPDETLSASASSAGTVFKDTPKAADTEKQERTEAVSNGEPSAKRNPRSSEQEIAEGIASVEAEMAKAAEQVKPEYVFPSLELLKKGTVKANGGQQKKIRETAAKLQQTLNSFGVHVTVTNVSCGPSVTRYEVMPEQGVKVSRIVALSDDIKLNLAAADIRIEAPIPGKAAVGIEVPNEENSAVALRDLLESEEFQNHKSKLAFATGKDIAGKVVVSDIAKMPHLLVAGATGSGKSVCMNTIIMSILYKAHPDEVKLIMIDPKVVELSVYNGIPHLFIPVVTDPKKAAGALNWAVAEMTDRYNKFAEYGVRDLKGYNSKIEALDGIEDENKPKKLPQIVIIVDELADLMMVAPGEVEDAICRLAQLARACGIHLIIATQRPSVNVITGLIKANMPSRIAFSVSSGVDSRTIIDMNGAEKLLGKGDMLFYPQGYTKPARVQGAFVSDEEVADVVDFLKNKNTAASYNAEMEEQIAKVQLAVSASRGAEDTDSLFADAGKFIIDKDKASIGMLQRVFKIGFNRAARIMDQLSDAGVVGPEEGTKPRKILMSMEQFENYLEENG